MFSSADEALKFIQTNDINMIDLKVVALEGKWLHITVPARSFTADHFREGVGYDGSSGSGFSSVENGDVVALPLPETAFLDPFWEVPTLSFICDTVTADTRQPFPSNPRTIARRAVEFMEQQGIADEILVAPEFEFSVFDSVRVDNDPFHTGYDIECSEVHTPETGPGILHKQGYLSIPPLDQLHDLRAEVTLILEKMGVGIRYHHHEVGAPGQCEIEVALTPLLRAADQAMLIKYVIRNVALRRGRIATFMPKPVYGEAGNGMHVHQKLQKSGRPLFYDPQGGYADLSETALLYILGLLRHGSSLTGITNPSTNSFKRLVEGYEAPVNLFYSLANRSAAIRVPRYAVSPGEKRIEYRPPDFTGNVYLSLAAMLMAGLDGIITGPAEGDEAFGPFDVDIASRDDEFRSGIAALPRTLHDALGALKEDHDYLLRGEVFPEAFLHAWIERHQRNHCDVVNRRPHPCEFELYLDT